MSDKEEKTTENQEKENGSREVVDKSAGTELVLASELLPEVIPIIPLPRRPLFPGMTIPLVLSGKEMEAVTSAIADSEHKIAGTVVAKEIEENNILESKLYLYGTAIKIQQILPLEENSIQIMVVALRRFRQIKVRSQKPVIMWQVEYFYDPKEAPSEELKAYTMAIISSVKELLQLNPLFKEQLKMLLTHISYDEPGKAIDLIASMSTVSPEKLQDLLETIPLLPRAEKLMLILKEEIELSRLQEKIHKSIEEKLSKRQKKMLLQEQLKAIKKELGLEKDDKTAELEKFTKRKEKLQLSEEATKVFEEEFQKLQLLEIASPEYHVCRNYLDWLTSLPWGVFSEENLDIKKAAQILDRDHYGLDDVKDRILEFISTIIKNKMVSGSIMCFVGPPGVGKTSIGKSIAEALGRKFYRFSVGGMRDEAEIKGHRRTYIGAMPGKFLQSLKTLKEANPVIMLDEVDKIGTGFRGDPASALLEVLDPEQNQEFLDHYLDVRFDLSNILFITTANQLDTIPPALLDRMEVIKLAGYIMQEKLEIAKKFLLPRLEEKHSLEAKDVELTDEAITFIIERYAREAGVRNLENQLKKIMRRIVRKHAEGDESPCKIAKDNIPDYLGLPIFPEELLYNKDVCGVTLGLAWTSMGGAALYIEASATLSKSGGYKQTGQLGKVMEESSQIAYSYIRSRAQDFNINENYFDAHFIHLHVPAGATPKDGPSAGITMATALHSLGTNKAIRNGVAMTGELTLSGKILPIGGVKEKVIAAKRVKISEVILPKNNEKDFLELPDHLREGVTCHFVDYFDDVLQIAYQP